MPKLDRQLTDGDRTLLRMLDSFTLEGGRFQDLRTAFLQIDFRQRVWSHVCVSVFGGTGHSSGVLPVGWPRPAPE